MRRRFRCCTPHHAKFGAAFLTLILLFGGRPTGLWAGGAKGRGATSIGCAPQRPGGYGSTWDAATERQRAAIDTHTTSARRCRVPLSLRSSLINLATVGQSGLRAGLCTTSVTSACYHYYFFRSLSCTWLWCTITNFHWRFLAPGGMRVDRNGGCMGNAFHGSLQEQHGARGQDRASPPGTWEGGKRALCAVAIGASDAHLADEELSCRAAAAMIPPPISIGGGADHQMPKESHPQKLHAQLFVQ